MRSWKQLALGTTIGIFTSLVSIALVIAGWQLFNPQPMLAEVILLLGLLSGAILGPLCVSLKALTHGREHRIVGLLLSIAIAAGIVLVGRYPNGSWLPLAIYATAILNGVMIPQITAVSTSRQSVFRS